MSNKIIKKQSRENKYIDSDIKSDIESKKDSEIELKNKIIKYIDSNLWTNILKLIKDKKFVNLNKKYLDIAEYLNLYTKIDYSQNNKNYCGMVIS